MSNLLQYETEKRELDDLISHWEQEKLNQSAITEEADNKARKRRELVELYQRAMNEVADDYRGKGHLTFMRKQFEEFAGVFVDGFRIERFTEFNQEPGIWSIHFEPTEDLEAVVVSVSTYNMRTNTGKERAKYEIATDGLTMDAIKAEVVRILKAIVGIIELPNGR